jgi:hypothetical protein
MESCRTHRPSLLEYAYYHPGAIGSNYSIPVRITLKFILYYQSI